jgi:ABC-2 type transport system ATP-binding protein
MRVRSYLDYRATLKGVPRKRRKEHVQAAMERCHVTDVKDRIIGHLSKGYRQRVGLADALVHRPKVLILDEPTSGLDPNQVRDVRDLIKDISEDTTVLFSTHTIPWVEQVCQRVIVISQGRIVLDGTLDEMREHVAPWSRVEFRSRRAAREAMTLVEAIPQVFFVENLTIGEGTMLRYLTGAHDVEAACAAVEKALGGDVTDVVVGDAVVEDLFTKLTRGTEQVVEVLR